MLFNSYEFILAFLPLSLIGFYGLSRLGVTAAKLFLALASLFFYAHWNISYLPILLGSIAFNWTASTAILARAGKPKARRLLYAAVAVNLGALAFYKYWDFLAGLTAGDLAAHATVAAIPLGISFFTFTQIAFLADAARGEVSDHTPLNYLLFVTVFPHLIAGPILHHRDMMPQFARPETYRADPQRMAQGLTLFALGLGKKVLLADSVVAYADPVFAAANPTLVEAWCGALAYTLQIYFDFSGYSDMAVGLGLLFGIRLPINFASPYRASSIIEFWRRWHISLSLFLRDYLYVPLGGNRRGPARRWVNLMATMVLGGLWHGANLTFVAWGALHGLALIVNHGWRSLRKGVPGRLERTAGHALTLVTVMVAWVFFRADNLPGALNVLRGLSGLNGVVLPSTYAGYPVVGALAELGIRFDAPSAFAFQGISELLVLGALLALAVAAPNTQAIVLDEPTDPGPRLNFSPNRWWAAATAVILAAGMIGLSSQSPFLYFQF
ncbi:hypothetical protein WV31_13145 [Magnetospirillum sp. ME-1]|uniref:MBOAT family O-acyltransferase n=1 Tax=Magnetospirillum sp. ME-1 TaxID=1639348 RepID=UPI000A17C6C4|nr:MBOAT family protein [Magnetospirillum sp. ME-1]ARJ66546.1 hypothetical protein WV31_13145 [Magnetospirillum sp. ME-1]